ncbi:MAG: acetyl-CoA carboxylase biotin carboxylase subunit [Alphaproteobacteria bacterium]|nr:acetyl-CoA carboxylase biotin carboxylase subunit [Alphaproteobacteria bacterium]
MFNKILIANRGEIALRIVRTCKEMDIETVVVHSTADANGMAVRMADESVCIGPPMARQSYLNIHAILTAATVTDADAIHPGIGFLSENEEFSRMVEDHGFTFIGPAPEHIATMGDKAIAKETMKALGIPTIPGSIGIVKDAEEGLKISRECGFPVLIKAVAGGGGKGLKVSYNEEDFKDAFSMASTEARAAFGNGDVYIEKYLSHPRHIEIQVIGDTHGNAVHLGERDCSIQRSHQKVIEECPSPGLTPKQRKYAGKLATECVRKMNYRGVGTIEFLFEDGEFYFMEMNTRLQVEHPVTEMITGIDLVREQIMVAAGHKLSFKQENVIFTGHAFECRINAEHPETFIPSPGKITRYHAPGGAGVRVDSAIYDGYSVPPNYDSLVAKLIVHARTREEALMRMERALWECVIDGIQTNIQLQLRILQEPEFRTGDFDIHWLENKMLRKKEAPQKT